MRETESLDATGTVELEIAEGHTGEPVCIVWFVSMDRRYKRPIAVARATDADETGGLIPEPDGPFCLRTRR